MSGVDDVTRGVEPVAMPPFARDGAELRLAVARARWLEVQDELLGGVTHALSNRIATVSAAAYMLEHEDISGAQAAGSLRTETERMDALLQLLRLLPSRDDSSFEPVAPMDVLSDAVALHAHHTDLRDVAVTVESDADVLPVWVEPHAFMQALLLALTSAKRAAFPRMLEVRVLVTGNADVVTIVMHPNGDVQRADATRTAIDAAAAECCLLSAHGTARAREDGGCTITLPTLPAVRRAGR
jgi:signal transduction histidine kinase